MGDVNVNGWVWVCVARDIVKRVWESIETHDLPPQVFNQTPHSSWESAPRERLALCWCTSDGAKASTNNSLPFYLFHYLWFSFSLNHGNSDLSVETAPGINSISDMKGSLFWPMVHKRSRLWAHHRRNSFHVQWFDHPYNLAPSPCYFLWTITFYTIVSIHREVVTSAHEILSYKQSPPDIIN